MNPLHSTSRVSSQGVPPSSSARPTATSEKVQPHHSGAVSSVKATQGVHATLALWAQTSDQSHSLNQLVWAESELHQIGGWVARHERLSANPQAANAPLQQALQQQLQQTDVRLQQGQSPLTVDLAFGPDQPVPKVLINSLPLLQTKTRDETLQVYISGKAPVRIVLPADAEPNALLQQLQYSFKRVGVQTELAPHFSNPEKPPQLRFTTYSGDQRVFFQPWQISGEGVRVAAGNPLISPFQNAHSPLHDLVKVSLAPDKKTGVEQQHHFSIIQRIKNTLNKVREALTQEHQKIEDKVVTFPEGGEAIAMSEKIKEMGQSHSEAQWVFAHRHIHRKVVEYGLMAKN